MKKGKENMSILVVMSEHIITPEVAERAFETEQDFILERMG